MAVFTVVFAIGRDIAMLDAVIDYLPAPAEKP